MKILLLILCTASFASGDKSAESEHSSALSQINANASAQMFDQNGKSMGVIKITQTHKGIKLKGKISGLGVSSIHGFHIHEVGECKDDFKSAGGHYDPFHMKHHGALSHSSHAGDLGNILADENGVAVVDKYKLELNIKAKNYSLRGKAFIVHKGMDDTESQPSGAAGPRIACGIIK